MNKYQVQYKYLTKTFVDDFEALSHEDVLFFFDDISGCEVIEIREYEYENNFYPVDDGNYINAIAVNVSNDYHKYSFKLPKIKPTLAHDDLLLHIKSFVSLKHKSITDEPIKATYR